MAWSLPGCSLCLRKGFGNTGFIVRAAEPHKANHSKVKEFGLRKGILGGRGGGGGDVVVEGPGEGDGQEAGIRVSINRYAGGNLEAVNQPAF